jgi:hypothetical protein
MIGGPQGGTQTHLHTRSILLWQLTGQARRRSVKVSFNFIHACAEQLDMHTPRDRS